MLGWGCSDFEFIFHVLLKIFLVVKAVIPALHFVGTGVGDALAAVLPPNAVAHGVHSSDEILAGTAAVHGIIDRAHQPKLPTVTLDRGAVFAGTHAFLF